MLTAGMHRTAFAALRQTARPAFSAAPLPAVLRPATVAGTRMLSMTPLRWSEKKGEETARPATGAPSDAAPSSDKTRATEADSEASRAALWDQMLNTIIVDPVDSANADARLRKPRDALGSGLDAWSSSESASGLSTSIMDQLESEFRARPTIGPAKPATTTTGRSVSAANSYGNNSAAMLYRNLMGTLRRNNVRRELRLEERYEKPNQKRRRLRSERHRRRFADMIRKKVQLVRLSLLTQIMALKARGA